MGEVITFSADDVGGTSGRLSLSGRTAAYSPRIRYTVLRRRIAISRYDHRPALSQCWCSVEVIGE